jgi:hypothetical protein
MCFTLYIGASVKLRRFTLPYVLNIGSDQGCGCGFRQSHVAGQEWVPVVEEKKDDFDAVQNNHVGLWRYLTGNVVGESIEIYLEAIKAKGIARRATIETIYSYYCSEPLVAGDFFSVVLGRILRSKAGPARRSKRSGFFR